jgi:hypothetical protein
MPDRLSEQSLRPKSGAERRDVSATKAAGSVAQHLLWRSDLLESERTLVELMEELNFGRIERLQLRDGRPILRPFPRVVAAVKMTGEDHKTDSEIRSGSCLKQPLMDLFALMRRVGDGELLLIEVRHGLPRSVEIAWLGNR